LLLKGKVSFRIVRDGKEQRMGEKLVKFRATDLAACMTDEKVARKIQLVPSTDKRNQRRIQDCVAIVLHETVQKLGLGESFTFQLGDSADFINLAILFVFGPQVYDGGFEDLYCANQLKQKQARRFFETLYHFYK
jgi:hypothetical protein